MALPPRGDPRRPLHLAIRSTRLLGIVLLLFGTCGMASFMTTRLGRGTPAIPTWIFVAGAMFYFIPGALFIVFAIFLARRQYWAVVGALVLSFLLGVIFLLALGGFAFAVISRTQRADAGMAIPVIIFCLFSLAIGQLIYHLSKSFEAIKHPHFGQEIRGFEPLPVRAVDAPPPVDPSPPARS